MTFSYERRTSAYRGPSTGGTLRNSWRNIRQVEFFENGWNPYTRFLDVDKVDLILRSGRTTEKESIARFKSSLESCIRLARCGSVSFLISPHRDSSKKMSLLARSTKVI